MKGNNISSSHDQTQLTQAQQSILHLQHAITQAQSNPNAEANLDAQINQALERAERSLTQSEQTTENQQALDFHRRELEQLKSSYQELKGNL
ncbi:hypothetical protein [Aquibacillus salsiterrae]|uniref:Uncharacterized protein n=1 Tax=Aquibacillus salsiterrae TaxID=2950439 RepID=A0A9X4AE01_9BACI|nr:hypothetical protein [Aquibacillus salsiterrae]MDC3416182.1 hypothetical protein [Aquibacillus salsiterrae]